MALRRPGRSAACSTARSLRRRHQGKQIAAPALRARLTPDLPIGCKRILISDDWYQALASDRCELVTAAIDRFVPEGVVTTDGTVHAADAVVLATGFESTSFLAPMQIVGEDGRALAEVWKQGAIAHRGVLVSGFPNLFLRYGRNTNLGHSSILFMIECQVRYILRCLDALARRGARWLDVRHDAMARFNQQLQERRARTTWAAGCSSWYKTADGAITNNWSGRTAAYWLATRKPDLDELELG
jgi:cation diffusion facilitator CzcD-associated flavoprotein CzcO